MPPTIQSTALIPGLPDLWAETLGAEQICVAILDGFVDRSHPSLINANLTQLEPLISPHSNQGTSAQHGTHVASIIFGQQDAHQDSIRGIAPNCRGVLIPIFRDSGDSIAPCSQRDLARAILLAANHGAHIINISGGQLDASGAADPLLVNSIRHCIEQNILIVAATGNDGCNCLHVPGALPSVLAVGAMNATGMPLDFSNWGDSYRTQGILALGENIPGAMPGAGIITRSGTSYATAVVSGIAALLLSLQVKQGRVPDPQVVQAVILKSAIGCKDEPVPDCRRLLAGRLNVKGAMSMIQEIQGETMNENSVLETMPAQSEESNSSIFPQSASATDTVPANSVPASVPSKVSRLEITPQEMQLLPSLAQVKERANSGAIQPSGCSCQEGNNPSNQLVYALGQLDYEFGTEARRDSIVQHMGTGANLQDPQQLLAYLDENPWDAAALTWTLNMDTTPIYAVMPQGAYAERGYERLRQFLREQFTEGVERVSVPGVIVGQVRLMSGQVVPVISPSLRGMYSWTTTALIGAVCGTPPDESASEQEQQVYRQRSESVVNFLERVYYELRNFGMTSQERAINYAATNAFNIERIFESAMQESIDLEGIDVERSPLCRPDSDCWDVKLTFFNPGRVFEQARKVYRFTVDVSDVCPVIVGRVRSWFVR